MLEELLKSALLSSIEKYGIFEEDVTLELEKPRDRSHGDLSTNLALMLGSRLDRNPRQLAGEIAAAIVLPREIIESVEIAGPGFINFRISEEHRIQLLLDVWDPEAALQDIKSGADKRINVEFISSNPTNPLGVISARAGSFGMSLVRTLEAVGYDAHAEYYVNDAGREIALLGRSLRSHYFRLAGVPCDIPEGGHQGRYIDIMAAELMEQDTDSIQKASKAFDDESFQRVNPPEGNAEDWRKLPEDESARCFGKYALMKILSWQRDTSRRFGLRFQTWYFESELHETKRIERVLERLKKSGRIFDKDGATCFRSTDFGDERDRVLVRADGTPTYFLADIAYHYHKFQRGFERAIDFWGPDHSGYIARMQGAMKALGISADWLEVQILHQVVFLEDGRPINNSREGRIVTMDALMEDVGADVAKYFFLTRKPNTPLDFDLDLARLHSNDNPVYFIKKIHAGICSLLKEAEAEGMTVREPSEKYLDYLTDPAEWALVGELIRLPQVIVAAARQREPHRLTAYVHEVAELYNKFLQQCKVLKIREDQPDLAQCRLQLSLVTRHVMRVVLNLIGVDAPEVMEEKG